MGWGWEAEYLRLGEEEEDGGVCVCWGGDFHDRQTPIGTTAQSRLNLSNRRLRGS